MQFCLLWSLFEAEVLNASANVNTIGQAVQRWHRAGVLMPRTFEAEAAYFKERYFAEGAFTHRFAHLHLERSGNPRVVEEVLSGEKSTPTDTAAALLFIVFRYRNNLFHGEKWAYELRGQGHNFARANNVLMRSIELNRQSLQP